MKVEIGITNTGSVNHPLKELPLVCKYYQDQIFVSTENGSIIQKHNDKFQNFKLHSNLIHDFIIKDSLIYSCSQDHTVCLFDLKSEAKSFLKFNGAVKSIIKNDNEIIVGCKDKTITILDTRSQNRKVIQDNSTTLQYQYNLYSMGSEGIVKLWDFRNYKPIELNVYENSRKYGFVNSCLNGNLFCLSMNNQIYEISLDLQVKKIFNHHSLQVGFFNKIDVSFCGKFLAVGSKSHDIILFGTDNVLKGHMNDVSGIGWSEYDYKLCSVADDFQLREWTFKVKNNYRKSLYFPLGNKPLSDQLPCIGNIKEKEPLKEVQFNISDNQNNDMENIPPKQKKQVKLKSITPIKPVKKKKQNTILKFFSKDQS
ncbi:hypothetical protein HK103_001599 [Boothiomyces macroporosus]|uniref:Uncharacterized protein n=1 Tax=Boothiomyces macroporosus TaxID=261099 RepID=A0AAD5Y573_9FUNG|nr:hypothetical protein HK103_001599 [Boothiomyces macroporosus]